ncbi:hypothetical protein EN910_34950, partial [Mesorhizobium sp. M7A.F.Ca.CA.004.01.1.1]
MGCDIRGGGVVDDLARGAAAGATAADADGQAKADTDDAAAIAAAAADRLHDDTGRPFLEGLDRTIIGRIDRLARACRAAATTDAQIGDRAKRADEAAIAATAADRLYDEADRVGAARDDRLLAAIGGAEEHVAAIAAAAALAADSNARSEEGAFHD